jgi:hypothetical protein
MQIAVVLLTLGLAACSRYPTWYQRICQFSFFSWLCTNPPAAKRLGAIPRTIINVRKLDCSSDSNEKLDVNVHVTNTGNADLAVDPGQTLYDMNGNRHQVSFAITVTTHTASGRTEMETNGLQQTFPVNDDETITVGPFSTAAADVVQLTATVSMTGGALVQTPDLSWTGTSQHPAIDSNGNINCDVMRSN